MACRGGDGGAISAQVEATAAGLETLPSEFRSQLLRLPSCFRGFDQRLEDLELLADRFAASWAPAAGRVTVIGVRTSGSYLAPLVASLLSERVGEGVGDRIEPKRV